MIVTLQKNFWMRADDSLVGVGLGMLVLSMVQDVLDKYRSREKEEEMTSVVLFDSDIYELKE